MIPPCFQACKKEVCIYWKKNILKVYIEGSVVWRNQLQLSIFTMIVSSFHGSNWSDPYVKETFCSHPLQQVVCSWFNKFWRVCVFQKSHCSPALLKVPIYSTELVTVCLFEKYCVKCTKALAAINHILLR